MRDHVLCSTNDNNKLAPISTLSRLICRFLSNLPRAQMHTLEVSLVRLFSSPHSMAGWDVATRWLTITPNSRGCPTKPNCYLSQLHMHSPRFHYLSNLLQRCIRFFASLSKLSPARGLLKTTLMDTSKGPRATTLPTSSTACQWHFPTTHSQRQVIWLQPWTLAYHLHCLGLLQLAVLSSHACMYKRGGANVCRTKAGCYWSLSTMVTHLSLAPRLPTQTKSHP